MSTDIETWIEANREANLAELCALLRIPSVSTDPERIGDVAAAATFVCDRLAAIGLSAQVVPTPWHPIGYAEWLGAPGAPTVLIYGHYDVQPPEPLEEWRNPPFEPTVEGENLIARGATDDKGQFWCHVKGIEAHLATRGRLPVNVKLVIEGEEEVGSPSLDAFLEAWKDRLAADVVVVSDSPMAGPGRPAITYGLRGLCYVEMSVHGPSHDLHSGLYGGAVRNPINALAAIIASLHDVEGRVAVDGFYENVRAMEPWERKALAALGHDEAEFRASVGVEATPGEPGYSVLERVGCRPTLDCNGIWGGYIREGAKTVLPREAHAKISCRLVPDQTPEEIEQKLRAHAERVCPSGVRVEVRAHHGTVPVVVSQDVPAMQAAIRAQRRVWGVDPVFTRGGGSIPVVSSFKRILGLDTVLLGLGLEDDRLHSPNEKFALQNYFQGIRTSALLLEELATG